MISNSTFQPQRIVVIGGGKGMGRWMIERVFLPGSFEIVCCDTDPQSLQSVSKSFGISVHHVASPGSQGSWNPLRLTRDDVVIFAVPLDQMVSVIQAVVPTLADGTFAFDIGSIKAGPLAALEAADIRHAMSLAGIHPLFGPAVLDPVGQLVTICRSDRSRSEHLVWLHGVLSSVGLIPVDAATSAHDKAMLYTQVLTHFCYLSFAKVLSRYGAVAELSYYRTPPYTFLTAFAGRILGSPAGVYAQIQKEHRAEAHRIREAFVEAARELASIFDRGDRHEMVAEIGKIVTPWRGADVAECQSIALIAINALQRFERRLYDLKKSQRICMLSTNNSGTHHIGRIVDIGADEISFEDCALRLGSGEVAVPSDEGTIRRYAMSGVHFQPPQVVRIKKRTFEILTDVACAEWILEHAPKKEFDLNIRSTIVFHPTVYERWIPRVVAEVQSVRFVEAYRRRDDYYRVTLALMAPKCSDYQLLRRSIESFLFDLAGVDTARTPWDQLSTS